MGPKVVGIILSCLRLNPLVEGLQQARNESENYSLNSSDRIFFGMPVNAMDFPFMVALHMGNILCGGSIIASQWVLTAAHCVAGFQCPMIEIVPAAWGYNPGVRPVQCYVHSEYIDHHFANDIALLRVRGNFLRDRSIRAIPLPPPGTFFAPGTPATIVGYGQMENTYYPNNLLAANLRIEDWNVCNEKYKQNDIDCQMNPYCFPNNMPRRVLCTQGQGRTPPGTCFGDSGGPVIARGYVAGVCSFVLTEGKYCKMGAPSMHTNVADYVSWIRYIMGDYYNYRR